MTARLEIIYSPNDYTTYLISTDKKDQLLKIMSKKPPAREILPDNIDVPLYISVPTISKLDLTNEPQGDDDIKIEKMFEQNDILRGNTI